MQARVLDSTQSATTRTVGHIFKGWSVRERLLLMSRVVCLVAAAAYLAAGHPPSRAQDMPIGEPLPIGLARQQEKIYDITARLNSIDQLLKDRFLAEQQHDKEVTDRLDAIERSQAQSAGFKELAMWIASAAATGGVILQFSRKKP